MTRIKWKMRRCYYPEGLSGIGYEAMVQFPVQLQTPGGTPFEAVKASASTPGGAMMKAAALAERIAENPLIKSMLPPGTSTAIKAAKMLGKAAKIGKLGKALKKISGKGAKRLAKKLLSFF